MDPRLSHPVRASVKTRVIIYTSNNTANLSRPRHEGPIESALSVTEGLGATEDCRMCAPWSRRKAVGANVRILFDWFSLAAPRTAALSTEWERPNRDLFLKSVSPPEASYPVPHSADESGVLFLCAVYVSNSGHHSSFVPTHRRRWLGGALLELTP